MSTDPGQNWKDIRPLQAKRTPFWKTHVATVVVLIVGLLQVGHQLWFGRSNPPPQYNALEAQTVEVLHWQRTHPQLHVRMADGSSRMVEFPTLTLGRRGAYYGISIDEQQRLVGKMCQMWGRPLRFSVAEHYQVFALKCDGAEGLRMDESIAKYKESYEVHFSETLLIFIPLYILGIAVTFWAESLRNRKIAKRIEA